MRSMRISTCSFVAIVIALVSTIRVYPAPASQPCETFFPPSDTIDHTSRPMEIEAGFSYEDLDNMFEDWRSVYVEVSKKLDHRTSLHGNVRQTDRFSLKDQEVLAGAASPVDGALSAILEVTGSPSHRVLPQWSLLAQVLYEFEPGWLTDVGWRHARFNAATVNLGLATVEHYWDSFRASYTAYVAFVPDAGTGAAHRLSASWFYDDRSAAGVAVSIGKEVENLGPSGSILSSSVRSFVLAGRHWLTPSWGVTYEVGLYVQGDFYTRRGLRLGFRYLI